jgi:predicted enzyme related to lactoylglutathione lyase
MQSNNAVRWFEIYVSDMDRAKAFYTAVFGRELTSLPTMTEGMLMYTFPWVDGAPGAAGALVKMPMKEPGQGGTLVYFASQDVAEESARAEGAGGKVVMPKMSIGEHGFIALVEDTEGNLIGLHSIR